MKKLAFVWILCMLLTCMSACGPEPAENTGNTTENTLQTEDTAGTEDTTEKEDPVPELVLSQADMIRDITLTKKGETQRLYTGQIPGADITWGSEDANIATFADGVVKAVAKGETTVWAEYADVRISCTVRCQIKESTSGSGSSGSGSSDSGSSGGGTTSTGSRAPVLAAPDIQTVDSSFFDDAVFIGDSISLKLSYYAASSGELGNAKFLVVGSYSVCNAIDDGLSLTYQGTTYKNVEEALAATGAKKLFIMLGMNDIARGDYGYVDGAIKNWGTLVDMLRSTCPDITIYIQSMTPVWTGGEKGRLNNTNVDDYNAKLEVFAANNGCKFINVAPYMKDSTGGLATEFCSDSYVHLTNAGAQTWIKVLKAYTGY